MSPSAAMLASLAMSLVIAVQWFLLGGAHEHHELFSVTVAVDAVGRVERSTWASASMR